MPNSNNHRRNKPQNKKKHFSKKENNPPTNLQPPVKKTGKNWGKKILIIAGIIATIFGITTGIDWMCNTYHTATTSKEELFKEEEYETGIAIPVYLSGQYDFINIVSGITEAIPIVDLQSGKKFSPNGLITSGGCTPFNLELLLQNNKLYVSTTFTDIDGNAVGKLNFFKWEARRKNISNYHPGPDNLELIDNYGRVMFNMRFQEPNSIIMNGYFRTDSCFHICNEGNSVSVPIMPEHLSPAQKNNLIKTINEIKKLNVY